VLREAGEEIQRTVKQLVEVSPTAWGDSPVVLETVIEEGGRYWSCWHGTVPERGLRISPSAR